MNDTDVNTDSLRYCPPSAPPPAPPPDFSAWSAAIPPWVWLTFALMAFFSMVGMAGMIYIACTIRQSRKRANDSFGTRLTLAALERRVAKASPGGGDYDV